MRGRWRGDDARPGVALRTVLRPRWFVFHLAMLGAASVMVLLGRWQLHVSERKHFDLQNASYVVQWWLFAAFAVFFWARVIRDTLRPPTSAASTGGEVVLAGGRGALARTGPAQLISRDGFTAPVRYRGYQLPDSSRSVQRTDGDEYHGSYNDYLWQIALADEQHSRAGAIGAIGADDPPGRTAASPARTRTARVVDVAPVGTSTVGIEAKVEREAESGEGDQHS